MPDLSFAPGFPMADFDECGMSVVGYGPDARTTDAASRTTRSTWKKRMRAMRNTLERSPMPSTSFSEFNLNME